MKIAGSYFEINNKHETPTCALTIEFVRLGARTATDVCAAIHFGGRGSETAKWEMSGDRLETGALLSACKQPEHKWRSGRGKVLKCDPVWISRTAVECFFFLTASGIDDKSEARTVRGREFPQWGRSDCSKHFMIRSTRIRRDKRSGILNAPP